LTHFKIRPTPPTTRRACARQVSSDKRHVPEAAHQGEFVNLIEGRIDVIDVIDDEGNVETYKAGFE
jgi:hypothetical protein